MADESGNKKSGKKKGLPKPEKSAPESVEESAYQDEKIFTIIYFHPTKYEDSECVSINCQACDAEVTHGYICELNVAVEDTGEEFLESYVICEDCYTRFVEPMLDIIFRNMDDKIQYSGNL